MWEERNRLAERLEAPPNPFWHFQSNFDALAVMRSYAERANPLPTIGHVTNFLGVKVDPAVFPAYLAGRVGTVEPMPEPNNWHADIAEWAAALRAVDLAAGTFRVVELGCGWGCWLANTGMAARLRGLAVELIGVEGDIEHVRMAHQTMAANGFQPSEYRIEHAIAASRPGNALFPIVPDPGTEWGSEPVFNATPQQVEAARRTGQYQLLEIIPVDVVGRGSRVDLLHVDIQGGESALLRDSVERLTDTVAYVVVGTHSRPIEGQVIDTMEQAGWQLEIERPCIFTLDDTGSRTITVDGVQGWRNPRLT